MTLRKSAVVIDTNVVLVASGMHAEASTQCIANCAIHLLAVMTQQRIALDTRFEILLEYQNKTSKKTGKRPGDVFVKWVLQNHRNSAVCDLVELEPNAERGYESFPDDARLKGFDPADRKFVAVAAAHPEQPSISQATDSKWLDWAPILQEHGVRVQFICPDDIKRFHKKKFGK